MKLKKWIKGQSKALKRSLAIPWKSPTKNFRSQWKGAQNIFESGGTDDPAGRLFGTLNKSYGRSLLYNSRDTSANSALSVSRVKMENTGFHKYI